MDIEGGATACVLPKLCVRTHVCPIPSNPNSFIPLPGARCPIPNPCQSPACCRTPLPKTATHLEVVLVRVHAGLLLLDPRRVVQRADLPGEPRPKRHEVHRVAHVAHVRQHVAGQHLRQDVDHAGLVHCKVQLAGDTPHGRVAAQPAALVRAHLLLHLAHVLQRGAQVDRHDRATRLLQQPLALRRVVLARVAARDAAALGVEADLVEVDAARRRDVALQRAGGVHDVDAQGCRKQARGGGKGWAPAGPVPMLHAPVCGHASVQECT